MSDQILELLAEEGMEHDAQLSALLSCVRVEATGVRPMPSAAVAALMPARPGRASRGARTHRRRVLTGLIVLGSLGVGVGAAAASPDVRSAAQQFAQTVLGALGPGEAPTAPNPAPRGPAEAPRPSSTGAPEHPTATDHPGVEKGRTDGSHVPGSGSPTALPGKGSPSPHPVPSPSGGGKSHHR
jgi:hypothetical protein